MSQKFGSFQGTGNTKYLNYNGSVTSGDIWFDHSNSAIKIYNGTSWDEVGSAFVGIDDNATSTAITIDSSENVGIGTTNPSIYGKTALVQTTNASTGGLAIVDSTSAQSAKLWCDTTNAYLSSGNTGADPLILNAGGGNVGIGTTSPTGALTISKASSDNALNLIRTGSNTANAWIWANSNKIRFGDDNAGNPNNTRMAIDVSTGNVGIGTTSPNGKLDITGSGNTDIYLNTGNNSGDNNRLFFGDTADIDVGYLSYDHGTNAMSFGVNAAERMRIDSSGNVILNQSAGAADNTILRITGGTAGFSTLHLADTADINIGYVQYDHTNNALTFASNNAERMRIDSSGNVGIGTTNPNPHGLGVGRLVTSYSTSGNLYGVFSAVGAGTGGGEIDFGNQTIRHAAVASLNGSLLAFYTNSTNAGVNVTERMRIDSSGNLLVGTTTTVGTGTEGVQIATNGSIITGRNQTSDQTHHIFKNPNGTVGSIRTLNNATSYVTSSDQRLKENIVDAPAGNIDAIRVRSFDWKANGTHQTYGMVAQELVDVAPEAVSQGETEDDMWGVDYSKLVPMMIKEIQDLKAEVAALKGE